MAWSLPLRYLSDLGMVATAALLERPVAWESGAVSVARASERIAVYGTLRRGGGAQAALGLAGALEYRGRCRLRGVLIDLGAYPGLVAGEGTVAGELYDVADLAVLRLLDRFEHYDPADPAGSAFVRRLSRLLDPPVDAWVWYYNRPVAGLPRLASGDWLAR
ncbi:MAG: gamma-glutamylcyclotransferase [Actinomycetota bacterium]|nr:gamma-glutamylcyclotransferase [Actinomycetota bacterium]